MADIKRYEMYEGMIGSTLAERGDGDYVLYTDHIAALEAAKAELADMTAFSKYNLDGQMKAEAVKATVKPLEWEYVERATMTYTASDACDVLYYIDQSFGSDSYYFTTIRWPEDTIYDGDDLPSAQAAAQADYERRILSTLVPSPALEAKTSAAEAVAWVIPGSDMARGDGFIDAMAWEEGEFTRPLYGLAPSSALEANVTEDAALAAQEYIARYAPVADFERDDLALAFERGAEWQIAALEANQQVIETLRAALEPFALEADRIHPGWDSERRRSSLTPSKDVTVGDYRHARAVLAALTLPTQDEEAGK